jgi:hypothetical protein
MSTAESLVQDTIGISRNPENLPFREFATPPAKLKVALTHSLRRPQGFKDWMKSQGEDCRKGRVTPVCDSAKSGKNSLAMEILVHGGVR